MNLLVVDATQPRGQFACFSTSRRTASRVEEVLSGHFQADIGGRLVVTAPSGVPGVGRAVLTDSQIPVGVGVEACLAQVMQWLEARHIRVDALVHRQAEPGESRAMRYLRIAHSNLSQVACMVDVDGSDLAPLARGALVAMGRAGAPGALAA